MGWFFLRISARRIVHVLAVQARAGRFAADGRYPGDRCSRVFSTIWRATVDESIDPSFTHGCCTIPIPFISQCIDVFDRMRRVVETRPIDVRKAACKAAHEQENET
ncbi:hypothetical protein [Burkholderia sp. BE17]|uniref:hypothetical protein n=1 Tax=Burkholderia sp. BE17 TaxID=2656644 RepID=UPI00128C5276|nr:hypothetical protein [Burkholderia sp. BE17]MPV64894.1 hypothetical protein [Burkholderia sp. BE17]